MESARLLDDWDAYGEPTRAALVEMIRRGEIASGRLPGRLDDDWRPDGDFVCLTGNAQTAICALELDERDADARLVNAAARLADAVCDAQHLHAPLPAVRGAVAGSSPPGARHGPALSQLGGQVPLRRPPAADPRLEREWRACPLTG